MVRVLGKCDKMLKEFKLGKAEGKNFSKDIEEQEKDLSSSASGVVDELKARLNMELKNKVTSFESFGMLDPSDNVKFTDSMIRAKQYFR